MEIHKLSKDTPSIWKLFRSFCFSWKKFNVPLPLPYLKAVLYLDLVILPPSPLTLSKGKAVLCLW